MAARWVRARDLVGPSDIAKALRVTPATVSRWARKYPTYPKPVATPGGHPVFVMPEILTWWRVTQPKSGRPAKP